MTRFLLIPLILSVLLGSCYRNPNHPIPDNGTGLSVSLNLSEGSSLNGHFGVYIWITDTNGNYITTINRYEAPVSYLDDIPTEWIDTRNHELDGVSMATLYAPDTFNSTFWNLRNISGLPIFIGTYVLCINLTIHYDFSSYYYSQVIDINTNSYSIPFTNGLDQFITGGTIDYTYITE